MLQNLRQGAVGGVPGGPLLPLYARGPPIHGLYGPQAACGSAAPHCRAMVGPTAAAAIIYL
jgi:hypothetical protein